MKDRTVVPIEKNQQNEEYKDSIEFIIKGLDSIDKGIKVETPNIEWFEQMVLEQKEVARKKFVKEVSIFLLLAIIIVSVVLFTLYQVPLIFFALQGLVTIYVLVYSTKESFKQVDEA
jgi:hypothetical protein